MQKKKTMLVDLNLYLYSTGKNIKPISLFSQYVDPTLSLESFYVKSKLKICTLILVLKILESV